MNALEELRRHENNEALIVGEVSKVPEFAYQDENGEAWYTGLIDIARLSGTIDTVEFIVSKKILIEREIKEKEIIEIEGKIKNYYFFIGKDTKRHQQLKIKAEKLSKLSKRAKHQNYIVLNCYMTKKDGLRETSKTHRKVMDITLAVNYKENEEADYIPAIIWGKRAERIDRYEIGKPLIAIGRIQSRKYLKQLTDISQAWDNTNVTMCEGNEIFETRTAYELSIFKILDVFK